MISDMIIHLLKFSAEDRNFLITDVEVAIPDRHSKRAHRARPALAFAIFTVGRRHKAGSSGFCNGMALSI